MPRLLRHAVSSAGVGAKIAVAVVLGAAALRTLAAWRWREDIGADVDMYRGLAANLLTGGGYVSPETGVATAFRPPLVPLIYAALGNAGWAILLFQILAGAATAGLTVRLARSLGLAWPAAGLAGTIVACDPILLRYTPRPMTEVTAALLTAGLLCRLCVAPEPDACVRLRRALLTGALFGLCALCRPTVWAFGGLLGLAWVWDRLRGRAGWLHGWGALAAGLAGSALIVGPWAGRNAAVFGRPILMTTHGGYTLHLANNEVFYREVVRGPAGAVWEGESFDNWTAFVRWGSEAATGSERTFRGPKHLVAREVEVWLEGERHTGREWREPGMWTRPAMTRSFSRGPEPPDELLRDRWHRDQALAVIQSDPLGFARAVPLRISRLWGPAPLGPAAGGLPGVVRWAVCGWNVVVFLLAAWGAVRVWGSGTNWRPVFLMLLSLTAVHAVYWSNARMRGPVVPALAVLAAAGVGGALRKAQASAGPGVGSLGGEGKTDRIGRTSR